MIDLNGKIALVTGAASGIGRASALEFARAGARVVVSDLHAEGLQETSALISAMGGKASAVVADVSHGSEVQSLLTSVLAIHGRLDCAHNNAGVECEQALLGEGSETDWDRVMNVNLKGVWLCMRAQLSQMQKQHSGAIVNTSSVGGIRAVPNGSSYSAAKHGVIGLTRSAALEYAGFNVRVNAICPGLTRTPMTQRLGAERPDLMERLLPPLRRMAEPAEIAGVVAFLCSDLASFITGQWIAVDGGATAG